MYHTNNSVFIAFMSSFIYGLALMLSADTLVSIMKVLPPTTVRVHGAVRACMVHTVQACQSMIIILSGTSGDTVLCCIMALCRLCQASASSRYLASTLRLGRQLAALSLHIHDTKRQYSTSFATLTLADTATQHD
jgi:hypothetical protein